jgi:hypothetical protein
LNRIAQAAIDTYTMTVVLSRATRALNLGLPSAEYEALLTQVYCSEVCFACNLINKNIFPLNSVYVCVYLMCIYLFFFRVLNNYYEINKLYLRLIEKE